MHKLDAELLPVQHKDLIGFNIGGLQSHNNTKTGRKLLAWVVLPSILVVVFGFSLHQMGGKIDGWRESRAVASLQDSLDSKINQTNASIKAARAAVAQLAGKPEQYRFNTRLMSLPSDLPKAASERLAALRQAGKELKVSGEELEKGVQDRMNTWLDGLKRNGDSITTDAKAALASKPASPTANAMQAVDPRAAAVVQQQTPPAAPAAQVKPKPSAPSDDELRRAMGQ